MYDMSNQNCIIGGTMHYSIRTLGVKNTIAGSIKYITTFTIICGKIILIHKLCTFLRNLIPTNIDPNKA